MAIACWLNEPSSLTRNQRTTWWLGRCITWILPSQVVLSVRMALAGQQCIGGCRHYDGPGSVTVADRHPGGPKYLWNPLSPSCFDGLTFKLKRTCPPLWNLSEGANVHPHSWLHTLDGGGGRSGSCTRRTTSASRWARLQQCDCYKHACSTVIKTAS